MRLLSIASRQWFSTAALTFAPLPAPAGQVRSNSLYAMLERRYEAYKDVVVRPFFRDHFARLGFGTVSVLDPDREPGPTPAARGGAIVRVVVATA